MPYLIKKLENDGRPITCGLRMPDGFYRVMEMNYGTVRQLDLLKAFGYSVTETDKAVGVYTEDHRPVDSDSLYHWIYREGPLVFLDELTPQIPEAAQAHDKTVHIELEAKELDDVRNKLIDLGVKFRSDAKLSTLKKKLDQHDAVA